ncbi:hypothetical protein GBF38_016619, partial [Nibea albiflora]
AEEKQKECQQTAALDVQEVEATEEEVGLISSSMLLNFVSDFSCSEKKNTSVVVRVIHHCKKAAEWVQDNKNLFAARVEMPRILHMNSTQSEEAAQQMTKLFETVHLNEEEMELILEPFKFVFYKIEDMWLFCEKIMDQRKYLAYCEYREDK